MCPNPSNESFSRQLPDDAGGRPRGWTHELLVEKVLVPDERISYPLCIAGARACPPEDVGGVGRYQDFLEALRDPEHKEHDEIVTWIGGVFDPEGFDLNAVNRSLRET